MTGRRTLVVGLGAGAGLAGLRPVWARAAGQGTPQKLREPLGECEVDWEAGLVVAHAGAAADLRLPGPDAVRAMAEKQARARAAAKLKSALERLPLGPGRTPSKSQIEAALGRATPSRIEYQSNGGVLLSLAVRFADLAAAAGEHGDDLTLAVTSTALEAVPTVVMGGREVAVSHAVYRFGDAPAAAVPGRRDAQGRITAEGTWKGTEKVRAVIYVRRPR